MAEKKDTLASEKQASGCRDRLLLIGTAFLVCILGGGAFWIADVYHISPLWVFLLCNSLFIVHLSIKDFRAHLREPPFVAFLVGWGVMHGLTVLALMRWATPGMWVLGIGIELLIGYLLADRIFHIRRASTTEEVDAGRGRDDS